jgi:hypothetical protein
MPDFCLKLFDATRLPHLRPLIPNRNSLRLDIRPAN